MAQRNVTLISPCDFSVLSSLDRFQSARVGLVSVRTRGAMGARGAGYRGRTTRGTQGMSRVTLTLYLFHTHTRRPVMEKELNTFRPPEMLENI